MRRPKILLGVTADVSIGLMDGLPQYMAGQGWDVHVVSGGGPRSDALRDSAYVTVHEISMRRDPAPVDDMRSLVRWIRLLRSVRPDLVSVGTPKAGLLGSVAGWLTRTPARVYLLRGLRYETTKGPKRLMLKMLERISVGASHSVVAVSDSLRQVAVADSLGAQAKFTVLGPGSSNGVDVQRFTVTPQERTAAQVAHSDISPVIGFIGRIHPDKGLDLLAQAAEILAERGVVGQLLVVGDSDDPAGETLKSRLRRSSWPVTLTGPLKDVSSALERMDLLCLPTLREGFPNVVLEAAAAGIPTVATAATGVPDAIDDGVTGLVSPNRDPETLANLLASLAESPAARTEMGEAARERVERLFTRPEIWSRTESYYASFLGRSHG